MEKQKRRSEISNEFKWNLSSVFKSDEEFYDYLEEANQKILKIKEFKETLNNANSLLAYLQFSNEIDRIIEKLYQYAYRKHDEDTTNPLYQTMKGKIKDLLVKYDNLKAFVNPELMLLDFSDIEGFCEEEPLLKEFEKNLEMFYRFKPHVLSKEEEKLISILSKNLDSADSIYTSLSDSDMTFGDISVDGKQVELTESNYATYIRHSNREVRKQAFEMLFKTYGNYQNTFASIFEANVDSLVSIAKIKNYPSSIEASLFSDNISVDVYNNLVETVNNHLDTIYKYYDLKKEVLDLKDIHLFDVYAPLTSNFEKEYTFDEAKQTVIDALSILGEDYIKDLKKAFDEKWIDIYNSKGKRGGAYSAGSYDTNPFILLNYEGTLRDVSTLAHELGHSLHSFYSSKNNPYQYYSYKIFVAEVASTVNELLLNHYLLEHAESKEEKLNILNELMELFRTTIYRQTMFAEFERDTHQKYEQGEILTYELLCNHYYDLNKKYFGQNVIVDDLIKYEWERIPHFYYNFYVYKYATGLSCACYIVNNIINNTNNMKEKYLHFLTTGCRDYPANLLKEAGIDVTKPEFIESAIKMFDGIMEQFKTINKR